MGELPFEWLAGLAEQLDDADAVSEPIAFSASEGVKPGRHFLERLARIRGQVGQKLFRRRDVVHRVIMLAAEFVEPLKRVFHPLQTLIR